MEGDLGHNSSKIVDNSPSSHQDSSPEVNAVPESTFVNRDMAVGQQLELDWGTIAFKSPDSTSSTRASQVPLTQKPVRKSQVWEHTPPSRQTERTYHLEQALDQCQIYINELKLQLANQQFLEAQLASTEEISNIQQQAIIALKTQLAEQQSIASSVTAVSQPIKVHQMQVEYSGEIASNLQEVTNQAYLEQQVNDLQALLTAQQERTEELESQNDLAQSLTVNLVNQLGETQKKAAN